MKKPITAIMCTGGIDSTTLLYMAKYEGRGVIPITVDYGQVAFSKQVELLNYHIDKLNLPPLVILKIEFNADQCKSGLFKENYIPKEENPLEDWDSLRYADFIVEGRNTIMVAYVMAYCSAHKIDEIWTGYLYSFEEWSNRRSYKLMTGDNSPQFIDAMNTISTFGFSHQVRIRAPFYETRTSKEEVIDIGESIGVEYDKTYSCYFIPECGVCDNCLLRKKLLNK